MRQLQSLSSFGNHIDPATFAVEHDMTINQRESRPLRLEPCPFLWAIILS